MAHELMKCHVEVPSRTAWLNASPSATPSRNLVICLMMMHPQGERNGRERMMYLNSKKRPMKTLQIQDLIVRQQCLQSKHIILNYKIINTHILTSNSFHDLNTLHIIIILHLEHPIIIIPDFSGQRVKLFQHRAQPVLQPLHNLLILASLVEQQLLGGKRMMRWFIVGKWEVIGCGWTVALNGNQEERLCAINDHIVLGIWFSEVAGVPASNCSPTDTMSNIHSYEDVDFQIGPCMTLELSLAGISLFKIITSHLHLLLHPHHPPPSLRPHQRHDPRTHRIPPPELVLPKPLPPRPQPVQSPSQTYSSVPPPPPAAADHNPADRKPAPHTWADRKPAPHTRADRKPAPHNPAEHNLAEQGSIGSGGYQPLR
ncbi:hypothetical protein AKJ16_DCAP04707 [Drosera capensis]